MHPFKNSIRYNHLAMVVLLTAITYACAPEQQDENAKGTERTAANPTMTERKAPSSQVQTQLEVPYKMEDVVETTELPEGVTIYYISKGNGPVPELNNNVLVNYHGMLEDGTVFDSSFRRGQPMDSPLQNLIRGWQLALTQVPVGSKVKLVIPPELGYGVQGTGNIPPHATLTFDIELISMY